MWLPFLQIPLFWINEKYLSFPSLVSYAICTSDRIPYTSKSLYMVLKFFTRSDLVV